MARRTLRIAESLAGQDGLHAEPQKPGTLALNHTNHTPRQSQTFNKEVTY
jgi:hypothetical protein